MTFLLRSKSGIYYYRKTSVDDAGKRREFNKSLRTADYKLAQFLALKRYFAEVESKEVVGIIREQSTGEAVATITKPLPSGLTVRKAIALFLDEKARTGHWTRREYQRGANMLDALEAHLGASVVTSVGRKEASSFKTELLTSNRSVTTINNYMKRAAMLWDWLLDRGDVSSNSFREQRRQLAALRDAWTLEQGRAFLAFASQQEEWRK
jgi:hypothetical protein